MIKNIFILIAVCAMAVKSSAEAMSRSRRNANTCGVPKSESVRIYGQSFTRGSYPWIVALMHTGFRPPKFFCGATLISKTFVISAAHCILEKHKTEKILARDIVALFGAHDLSDAHESGRYQLSPIKVYIHDDWNPDASQYDADLSLLEFEEGFVHFNDFVQPIYLWDSESEPPVIEGVVIGWEKGDDPTFDKKEPKLVKVVIQSNEEFYLSTKPLPDLSSRRTFCAGPLNGSGVCSGDSDGGLFIKVDDVFYLRGILSSSLTNYEGCDASVNAVYTNVFKFKEWIKDITEKGFSAATRIKRSTTTAGAGSIQATTELDSNPVASKTVLCTFEMNYNHLFDHYLSTCKVDENIESEEFILGSPRNDSIELFIARYNRKIEFLPRHLGEKLPNLKDFWAYLCGLKIVRDFYFKNMGSLEYLDLNQNQITKIEANAFDDLVSLRTLKLNINLIKTFDEKLFVNMINLEWIDLEHNQIKFLSPTSFKIPGGKLRMVGLEDNVCIDGPYNTLYNATNDTVYRNFIHLEPDLRANCSGSLELGSVL